MKRITLPLLFVLSALSPAAFASNMTDCWLGKVTDEKLLHFNCQHNSRINSNGHRVQDVSMHGSKNDLNYSLVLWTDPKSQDLEVEFIRKGVVTRVPAWYDSDNDLRWNVHGYAFSLRYSQDARGTSRSFGSSVPVRQSSRIDLDRPMTTGLRESSTVSEFGL